MSKNPGLKALTFLGIAAALARPGSLDFSERKRNVQKPIFTEEELAELRSLPKKKVNELRAKYSKGQYT